MTRKYLYIITGGSRLCTVDLFLMVSVSHKTTQGIRDAKFLTHYAAKMGHFFALWSPVIDDFIIKCKKSLMFPFRSHIKLCNARKLVKHFKNGNHLTSRTPNDGTNFHFLDAISPSFYFKSNLHASFLSAM